MTAVYAIVVLFALLDWPIFNQAMCGPCVIWAAVNCFRWDLIMRPIKTVCSIVKSIQVFQRNLLYLISLQLHQASVAVVPRPTVTFFILIGCPMRCLVALLQLPAFRVHLCWVIASSLYFSTPLCPSLYLSRYKLWRNSTAGCRL